LCNPFSPLTHKHKKNHLEKVAEENIRTTNNAVTSRA
jgi:hypothetical protein